MSEKYKSVYQELELGQDLRVAADIEQEGEQADSRQHSKEQHTREQQVTRKQQRVKEPV